MDTNSERGVQTAHPHHYIDLDPTEPHHRQRRGERRDPEGLFAYQGPERRSGNDRRASA